MGTKRPAQTIRNVLGGCLRQNIALANACSPAANRTCKSLSLARRRPTARINGAEAGAGEPIPAPDSADPGALQKLAPRLAGSQIADGIERIERPVQHCSSHPNAAAARGPSITSARRPLANARYIVPSGAMV